MLDINEIRKNPQKIERKLRHRDNTVELQPIVDLDAKRRDLIQEVEQLRHERNEGSEKIGTLKRESREEEAQQLIEKMASIGDRIDELEAQKDLVEEKLHRKLAQLPNIPHESVPVSDNEDDKVVLKTHGKKPEFSFTPRNHVELGNMHDILDFERAAKIAGTRFPLYKGLGASLEMALLQFMFFHQVNQNQYDPVFPPFLANEKSYFTSAQLPKFEQDLYSCPRDELYLNPTAESILVNLHRDEILKPDELPKKYTAYTTCFRREAGSYGEEERGLIRTHQFNKVELFQFVKPQNSYEALTGIVRDAEQILQLLDLHYRVVLLPTCDLAQQASKTIDIEVWLPAQEQYYEVSSCSNCENFQALRGKIRFRPEEKAKPVFVHTLNGSGLATSRLLAAILENNQHEDGSISIPRPLQQSVNKEVIK